MSVGDPTSNTSRGISAVEALVALLKRLWRSHNRLISTNPFYRAVTLLLADLVIAQIDLHRLFQVIYDLLILVWAGHRPAY